ncbi:hypothetical protein E2C01_072844 [Portunus trituberculatus]|uniref:Uncharacterized protein n=1 Tax=Portunus trituberculatus TaxID=210409 RepID=A0A5B7I158_PORTR|nr:hypothetical protein [Portunus trituberculatus]
MFFTTTTITTTTTTTPEAQWPAISDAESRRPSGLQYQSRISETVLSPEATANFHHNHYHHHHLHHYHHHHNASTD